ncbi:L,D-transpeptidase [Streptomyces sp. NPDC051320]|uniref:L,D-transpeptidase n=1 Tax=Streptomyces sp. NPDC051320 TaxID=3154644 RepID=UPI003422BB43
MGGVRGSIGIAWVVGALLAATSACGGNAAATGTPTGAKASVNAKATAHPTPTHPAGPPMLLDSIAPKSGATVGVAMPISVVFSNPVGASARSTIEKHLKVTSSVPVTGAWHWFSSQRVDWRPKDYWKPGTKVKLDADLKDVSNGNGRYGTHGYQHTFTIGDDVEATASVPGHSMKVLRDGKLVRTLPIDAGSPSFPSWDGTMAVMDKAREVHMTSCSVHISCTKGSPNFYDLTLPWDVHLTNSGTYIHYSTGDPYPGHSYGSHGCVHLSLADSKWFYDFVKQGDPVTITGSPRGKADGDNGYAAFNLTWSKWLQDSATGAQQTAGTL